MVNRELEHVLRLWKKSILMSDSADSLLSSPGVCLDRLQSKYSDHVSFVF